MKINININKYKKVYAVSIFVLSIFFIFSPNFSFAALCENGNTETSCACFSGSTSLGAFPAGTDMTNMGPNLGTGFCSQESCMQYCIFKYPATTAVNYGNTIFNSSVYNASSAVKPENIPTITAANSGDKFTYKLLESFPGFFTGGQDAPYFPTMILAIYKFGIWTIGIASLFMITIGGAMYMMSAGNSSKASSAKDIIYDSLIGIVAAMGAYLFLYVINPDLTNIKIAFTKVNITDVQDFGGVAVSDNGNKSTSGGCIKPVIQARGHKDWVYDQTYRGTSVNGIRYTDCSDFVSSAYVAAKCMSPGANTQEMYSNKMAKNFNSASELKAGDSLVNRVGGSGHVVLCMDDGCTQVIQAPGKGKPITVKGGSYFNNKSGDWSNALVLKATDFCGGC